MQFIAKARYVRFSPYKLRTLADIVRGKSVTYALNWLKTFKVKRAQPLTKVIESAVANAHSLKNINPAQLSVQEICIDQGPIYHYFRPGAMGRAMPQRKRSCHISVKLNTLKPSGAQNQKSSNVQSEEIRGTKS